MGIFFLLVIFCLRLVIVFVGFVLVVMVLFVNVLMNICIFILLFINDNGCCECVFVFIVGGIV